MMDNDQFQNACDRILEAINELNLLQEEIIRYQSKHELERLIDNQTGFSFIHICDLIDRSIHATNVIIDGKKKIKLDYTQDLASIDVFNGIKKRLKPNDEF